MEDAGVRHSGAQRDEGTRNELRGLGSRRVLQNGCLMDMIWQMDLQIFNGYLRKMNISWILVLNIENEDFMDI